MTWSPANDGTDHVNVWSRGQTLLGRMSSNFAHTPFHHPEHGFFQSVEGFWYWLGTGRQHALLQQLHGYSAKAAGLKFDQVPVDDFEDQVIRAIFYKVQQTPLLRQLLEANTLPLAHYFVYGEGPAAKVHDLTAKHGWQLRALLAIVRHLQDPHHPLPTYAEVSA